MNRNECWINSNQLISDSPCVRLSNKFSLHILDQIFKRIKHWRASVVTHGSKKRMEYLREMATFWIARITQDGHTEICCV